jgi:hypothetical protein
VVIPSGRFMLWHSELSAGMTDRAGWPIMEST